MSICLFFHRQISWFKYEKKQKKFWCTALCLCLDIGWACMVFPWGLVSYYILENFVSHFPSDISRNSMNQDSPVK